MAPADWRPAVGHVGGRLRARTKDRQGDELGTFTDATRPTGVQVEDIIDQALADVAAEVGEVPEGLWSTARTVATLGAALDVELTYWPEQVGTDRSPYAQMKVRYDEMLKRLTAQVAEVVSGGQLGEGDTRMPRHGFPEDRGGLVGWGTEW